MSHFPYRRIVFIWHHYQSSDRSSMARRMPRIERRRATGVRVSIAYPYTLVPSLAAGRMMHIIFS